MQKSVFLVKANAEQHDNGTNSERMFQDFLRAHSFDFIREFVVGSGENPKNVDFRIQSSLGVVFADVKEIRDSPKRSDSLIVAQNQLKKDVGKLREKFTGVKPTQPVILVSMNFCSCFITGLTVLRAMFGDLVVDYNVRTGSRSRLHYARKGTSAFNPTKHLYVSGILVFDWRNGNNVLFNNPYAQHPVPQGYFPKTQVLSPKISDSEAGISQYSSLIFWGIEPQIEGKGPDHDFEDSLEEIDLCIRQSERDQALGFAEATE